MIPFSLASYVDHGLRLAVVESLLYVAVLIAWVVVFPDRGGAFGDDQMAFEPGLFDAARR